MKQARLLLEDGTCLVGKSFGAEGTSVGEVVFNTSMTGYQEILTDPSYYGQMITLTYPLIGNYGFTRDDDESIRPYAFGLIVREHAEYMSNWRQEDSIDEWLKLHKIVGISGIDTRMLTRKIRLHGTMRGILTTGTASEDELQEVLRNTPLITDQVKNVSTRSVHISPNTGKRVVLMDFGSKHNIQRELSERNGEVISVPYRTTAEEILRYRPDGVILTNGPGDPKDVPEAIETVRSLLGKVPIFGICLGHQLLSLACGADTEKLKFGHRGGNHPVKEISSGRTVMTAQNHGYTVTAESIDRTRLRISHVALNDGTIEGVEHLDFPAFSVQYHPESAPGPLDSGYLFDRFMEMMEHGKDAYEKKGEKVRA
ncbi:glutamine-hydrolyzing carbamoyl-phosphate synthase small subunit [Thermoactinomyces sp. DSM 45892]|uniref:glutamine-hydrolyzing carbamoyl-phosphate synthase small subunit n=1 Tax=Thermoactinomyces sp. DSM 45892 TaxID=1882753 RepID=UPI00089D1F94|nr:glutamine-hydrolyzing carbamoyl-phosphate synthase small subunit [Thermoactinomyces sp. DSM 45892]SDY59108.1 carbamoyl-phosphate synthase small subunit [Thermoactinomyces sp. DSM 45892]